MGVVPSKVHFLHSRSREAVPARWFLRFFGYLLLNLRLIAGMGDGRPFLSDRGFVGLPWWLCSFWISDLSLPDLGFACG